MAEKLNILWIQTDEQRPDSLGCYGSKWAKTPHIDAIAQSGVVFQNAVCQSPLCVPSRASQLTCRYPQDVNTLTNQVCILYDIFPKGTLTFPEVFKKAGYETVSFGKSHTPRHPTWEHKEGPSILKEYAAFSSLNEKYNEEEHHVIKRPGPKFQPTILAGTYPVYDGNPSRVITNKAIGFLKSHSGEKPFLLRVSHNWPHSPVLPPPPYDELYNPDEIPVQFYDENAYKTRAEYDRTIADVHKMKDLNKNQIKQIWKDYMGLVGYVDHEVGRLMKALKESSLLENTMVFFSSDHGKLLGEWGAGEKTTFDQEVWRVPFIWSCPGKIPAAEVRPELCELIDTGRTLLSLCGLENKIPGSFKGRDLFNSPKPDAVFGQIGWPNHNASLFQREDVQARHKVLGDTEKELFYSPHGPALRLGIRTEQYRMDLNWIKDGNNVPHKEADGNLFDLMKDPREKKNLWNDPECQEIVANLTGQIDEWFYTLDKNSEIFNT